MAENENKLTEHELQLLEYSFFSLCEEVDLFYCRSMEAGYLAQIFDDNNMREAMLGLMEGLESFSTDSEKWHSFLRRLYLFSMGEFKTEEDREERKEPEGEDSNNGIVVEEEKKAEGEEEAKQPAREEVKEVPQGKSISTLWIWIDR